MKKTQVPSAQWLRRIISVDTPDGGRPAAVWSTVGRKDARRQAREAVNAAKDRATAEDSVEVDLDMPNAIHGINGKVRAGNLKSRFRPEQRAFSETAFSVAAAYPFLSGASLGHEGAYIGVDEYGGGAFCFDPWVLYQKRIITGMSMIIMGHIGTGKSTCAKSVVSRLVLLGRKALVLADRKGEWDAVATFLGGMTIKVGPGLPNRINPLDEGIRPHRDPEGEPMTDQKWAMIVRARRLNVLRAIGEILLGSPIMGAHHTAISTALDRAVAARQRTDSQAPTLPEFIDELRAITRTDAGFSGSTRDAADGLLHAYGRCTEGDLMGMFDGPTTVRFDPDAPIITVNTAGAAGATPEARKVVYACTGSWAESMITNDNHGKRLCVYEEGWDSVSDEASLTRMVEAWKLARDYAIFNILIVHKLDDLNIAGDVGSKASAKARSLLGDTEIKVIYRQETANLAATERELALTSNELAVVSRARKGSGLWKMGERAFYVANKLTKAEVVPFDTDMKMRDHSKRTEVSR